MSSSGSIIDLRSIIDCKVDLTGARAGARAGAGATGARVALTIAASVGPTAVWGWGWAIFVGRAGHTDGAVNGAIDGCLGRAAGQRALTPGAVGGGVT